MSDCKIIANQSDARLSTAIFVWIVKTLLTRVSTKNAQSEHAYGASSLQKNHKRAHPYDSNQIKPLICAIYQWFVDDLSGVQA